MTRIVKFVPTRQKLIVRIEKLFTPFPVVSAKIKGGLYIGETARSVGERFKEHIENYESEVKSKYERSALYKHSIECHNGRKIKYELKIFTKCSKDPMKRQISESEYISHLKPELNSKDE